MHFVPKAPGRHQLSPTTSTQPILLESQHDLPCAAYSRPIGSHAYFASTATDSSSLSHNSSPTSNPILTPPLTNTSTSVASSTPPSPAFPASMAARIGDPNSSIVKAEQNFKSESAFQSPVSANANVSATSSASSQSGPANAQNQQASRKRASRAGTRSVSTLSAAQLERKRANDREAQRAIRLRTKEHIDRLEKQVEALTADGDHFRDLEAARDRIRFLEEENRLLKSRLDTNATGGHFGLSAMSDSSHPWEDMSGIRPSLPNGNINMMSQPQLNSGVPSAARHEPSFHSQVSTHWQSGASFGSPAIRRSGPSPLIGSMQAGGASRESLNSGVNHSSAGLPQSSVAQNMDYSAYMAQPSHQRQSGTTQYGAAVSDHTSAGAQQSHQIGGLGLSSGASYGQASSSENTPRFMPHQQPPPSSSAPHQSSQSQAQGQPGFPLSAQQQQQHVYYGQPRYPQQ